MAAEMNFFKRLKGQTPKFFKRVIVIALTVSGVAGAIIEAHNQGVIIPDYLITICQHLLGYGIIVSIIAKSTIDDTEKKDDEPVV